MELTCDHLEQCAWFAANFDNILRLIASKCEIISFAIIIVFTSCNNLLSLLISKWKEWHTAQYAKAGSGFNDTNVTITAVIFGQYSVYKPVFNLPNATSQTSATFFFLYLNVHVAAHSNS